MIQLLKNQPLAQFTTFKVGGLAKFFVEVSSVNDLKEALKYATENNLTVFILSGGSNMLISDNGFDGLVIRINLMGSEIVEENDDFVVFKASAGENWDDIVNHTVQNGWWGVENLSHIPGRMGAFVVQNVGAYGQDASQVVHAVEVLDTTTMEIKNLSNKDCNFTYRKSIFNSTEKGRYIVLSVTLKLNKKANPNIAYKDVEKYFAERTIQNPSQRQIREAIVSIRNGKFPFPVKAIGGNSGSFFSNIQLTEDQYVEFEKKVANIFDPPTMEVLQNMRSRFTSGELIKIPTAFILDKLGLKGTTVGGAIVNPNQPMVLMNIGNATSSDVMELFKKVRQTVYNQTGVKIINEPELIGFTKQEIDHYFEL